MSDLPTPNSPISWRDVYGLVSELRADMNRDLGKIEGRLDTISDHIGSLERSRAASDSADALEDTLTQRRSTAFRWQVGIAATVFFSGLGMLLTVAHILLHLGG